MKYLKKITLLAMFTGLSACSTVDQSLQSPLQKNTLFSLQGPPQDDTRYVGKCRKCHIGRGLAKDVSIYVTRLHESGVSTPEEFLSYMRERSSKRNFHRIVNDLELEMAFRIIIQKSR